MVSVFKNETLGPTARLVMLSLADNANDEGMCYPSIAKTCSKTGLSERAVRKNIRALEAGGFLIVRVGAGRGGSNLYTVIPNPAGNAPRQEMPPGKRGRKGGQEVPEAGAGGAPKPSLNPKESSACTQAREETNLEMFARKIREGVHVAPTALKPAEGREMVRLGLVTAEQLSRIGVWV